MEIPDTNRPGTMMKHQSYYHWSSFPPYEEHGTERLPTAHRAGLMMKPQSYYHWRSFPSYGEPDWTEQLPTTNILQYKESIRWKNEHRNESSFLSGKRVSLAALYTEPVIIQKNKKGSFQNISVEELFNKSDIHLYYPATVILQGNSGSGKSFIAQKIMLDWASEKCYLKDFDLAFYLRCDELKCISEEMSLIELLSWNCSLTSGQISRMLQNSAQRVLFIIDGLDKLKFMHHERCISSKFQRAPPEVIVCSILSKQILPRSVRLITTRTDIPQGMLFKGPQRLTEIMGFSEKGVEEYFQKFFQNEELFRKAYACVRSNETLITTCSTPVICWIICIVMRERFSDCADVTSGLDTTTSIYVDFVSTLLEHHCQGLSQSVPEMLRSLGQLAERGMLEDQVLFDEKTVYDTISDPVGNSFLCKFLSKKRIRKETMFSFTHLSFQEFFTALYYVLLDEEESQRKVKVLLHNVERGWAVTCWSDRDFSKADVEVRHAKLLQPVILFLCGLCKKEWISSFFEKHNMTLSINIEAQLKEWINQCLQRYQNEHLLFILHCLYELHEKSFVGKVLEHLVLIHLSNTALKRTDCWVLRYCLMCFEHVRNVKLHATSDNPKMLQPDLLCLGKTVLIQPAEKRFTEELKTKRENIGKSSDSSACQDSLCFPDNSLIAHKDESSSAQSSSEDAEVFTPKHVQGDDKDKRKNKYRHWTLNYTLSSRFVCAHAGQFQCSLTSLVFVMEGEGEVLYRVVSWDPRLLDGLGQMQPAGPLYNIDCFNGTISGLHLPHCEIISEENKDSLTIARFTGGNVEIMKPFKVSETHVMIDIRDLSHFGLLKKMIFHPSPVIAQVLLFLRPITARQRENILDVHLLPWNVPLSKVKDQHMENIQIKTSSKCSLTPESEYSLCCHPEGSTVQPETETFECNYGPNYHPTYEVFVDVNIKEIRLSLLDKTGREVWEPRRIPLTGQDIEPIHRRLTECEFVKKHRDKLIQRVSSVMTVADGLRAKDMIPDEMYNKVHAAEPRQEKTRLLLDALDSGGAAVKAEFCRLLKENEHYLVDELEPGPSRPQ
ncbi:NACHT, LRR and PYD domains-containing protein 1 homolog [Labeo rohita]|uniref:NACHT, LRR and PYD domains-containing protein 1 homolog n=1 Tax=Labeo rohita TaxID=84645 RepID=UPI0021E31D72|nr:NACHT, LRR and PYD domains-containing protein 1 homolog [Labeo rohita]